jgi:Rps23 Pro-64 3,4-dihydroxylase Tpa1-like proline 4-hydroxylase
MIIHVMKQPFGHIIVENTFDDDAYNAIWQELMFLQPRMKSGYETGASRNLFGAANKNGFGIFLNDIFTSGHYSDIFLSTRQLMGHSVVSAASQVDTYFQLFKRIIKDSVLVQCYRNGDYYLPHKDDSIFTIVTLMHNTPKKYSGGELYFPEYNYEVSLKNNHSIIFASSMLHEVKEVTTLSKDPKDFRYTISMFLEDRENNQSGAEKN